jgi:hypothetical protein
MQSYNPHGARPTGLGCSLFARHYLGNHYCFIFLPVLRCFSSRGLPPDCSGFHAFSVEGCPIRKSSDIMLVCSSPKLIAAYHVLHRLSEPRHPPYALKCFKKVSPLLVIYNLLFQYVKELFSICKYASDGYVQLKLLMIRLRTFTPFASSLFGYQLFACASTTVASHSCTVTLHSTFKNFITSAYAKVSAGKPPSLKLRWLKWRISESNR